MVYADSSAITITQPANPSFEVTVHCATSYDCSASITNSSTGYFVTDTTTVAVPVCKPTPSNCPNEMTATLVTQSGTPAADFATITKNNDNSWSVTLVSNDPTIEDHVYGFRVEFADTSGNSNLVLNISGV